MHNIEQIDKLNNLNKFNKYIKHFSLLSLLSIFTLISLHSNLAQAENCPSCGSSNVSNVSNASNALSLATSTVIEGSIDVSAAAGSIVIESVAAVGDGIVIVAKGASDAASTTIKLSGRGVQQLGLASDTVLQVSAVVTGHLLIVAGKAIAFIPNEIGKELVYQAKLK